MLGGRFKNLRARLLLLVLFASIPSLAVILYNGLEERRDAEERARSDALRLARNMAIEQRRLVSEARQFLILLSHQEEVASLEATTCEGFLRELEGIGNEYANLGAINLSGEIVCSNLPLPMSVNVTDREYFRRAIESRDFAVGGYQIGRVTGRASLNFGHPLFDEEGEVSGVVFAALPLTWVEERLSRAQMPEGSVLMVLDSALVVLAMYPGDELGVEGEQVRDEALTRAIRDAGGELTIEVKGRDGVQRLYAVTYLLAPMGRESAYVLVGIPTQVAYAAANQGLFRSLATFGLVVLFGTALAWWGGTLLVVRQVKALIHATRSLTAGDWKSRVSIPASSGEFVEMGRAFNEMAHTLEQREREGQENAVKIARLNRVYEMLSGINAAILRVKGADELMGELCRIAVEVGHFPLAVVHRTRVIEGEDPILAWQGDEAAIRKFRELLEDPRNAEEIAGAIEDEPSRVVTLKDEYAPCCRAWHELLESENFPAIAVLRLQAQGKVWGGFTLLSNEAHIFDEEEVRLLLEMAANTSLRLRALENEIQIEYLSSYDSLTGLPNQTLFQDRLQQALRVASQAERFVAVLMVRLDRYNSLVATLGHHEMDEIVREEARYLSRAVYEEDTVARIGGGDFSLILADVEKAEDVPGIVNRIVSEAPQEFVIEGEKVFVSLSVGVAIYPVDGETPDILLRDAALARQTISSEVSNAIEFYSTEINSQAQEKRIIERELRSALETGDEIVPFYQPVVEVSTRKVIGVESLLRWKSPELGLVSPGKFIPVAEETGLINRLGDVLLEKVCRQGKMWKEEGHENIHINVNVSVNQLKEADFVERFAKIRKICECEQSQFSLGLEITESGLMENIESTADAFRDLQSMGVRIYIDDFGTGYSSLAYLRVLPVDTLKIDTSFVQDIATDKDAAAVVRGIIAMAKSLELQVIAEGVEDEEQFAALKEMGCDAVQGFLFGKPAEAGGAERLFGHTLSQGKS